MAAKRTSQRTITIFEEKGLRESLFKGTVLVGRDTRGCIANSPEDNLRLKITLRVFADSDSTSAGALDFYAELF